MKRTVIAAQCFFHFGPCVDTYWHLALHIIIVCPVEVHTSPFCVTGHGQGEAEVGKGSSSAGSGISIALRFMGSFVLGFLLNFLTSRFIWGVRFSNSHGQGPTHTCFSPLSVHTKYNTFERQKYQRSKFGNPKKRPIWPKKIWKINFQNRWLFAPLGIKYNLKF